MRQSAEGTVLERNVETEVRWDANVEIGVRNAGFSDGAERKVPGGGIFVDSVAFAV